MTDTGNPAHQMREGQAEELLEQLADLHKQATVERSHYYVGSICVKAAALIRAQEREIMNLREALREDADDLDDAGKPVAAASIRSLAEAKPSHPGEDGV